MTLAEAKEGIKPNSLELGVHKSGTTVPFRIENTTGVPIMGYSKSCGCVGEIFYNETAVWGEVSANYQIKKDKNPDIFLVDGTHCLEVPTPQGNKYLGITTKTFIDNPQDIQRLKSYKFEQSITVRLQDDSPAEFQKENGEVVPNTDKPNVHVPISFYVIQ